MGTRDTSTAERAGGRLAYGMSDLTGSFPYTSGTELGVVLDVQLSPGVNYVPLANEDRGEVFNVLYTGGNPVLMARFVNQDTSAISFIWPNTTTSTGDELVDWPGSDLRAGQFVSGSTLLWQPDNGGPALLLYNAIPMVDVNEALRYSFRQPHSYVAMFMAIRDGSNRIGQMGPVAKLTAP